jgi:hypothetical protein
MQTALGQRTLMENFERMPFIHLQRCRCHEGRRYAPCESVCEERRDVHKDKLRVQNIRRSGKSDAKVSERPLNWQKSRTSVEGLHDSHAPRFLSLKGAGARGRCHVALQSSPDTMVTATTATSKGPSIQMLPQSPLQSLGTQDLAV